MSSRYVKVVEWSDEVRVMLAVVRVSLIVDVTAITNEKCFQHCAAP